MGAGGGTALLKLKTKAKDKRKSFMICLKAFLVKDVCCPGSETAMMYWSTIWLVTRQMTLIMMISLPWNGKEVLDAPNTVEFE